MSTTAPFQPGDLVIGLSCGHLYTVDMCARESRFWSVITAAPRRVWSPHWSFRLATPEEVASAQLTQLGQGDAL